MASRRTTALVAAGTAMASVIGIGVGIAGPAQADSSGNSREQVIRNYQEILLPALDTPIGWTGDTAACSAGDTSAEYQQATLTAVNYVRDLAGQPPVTLSGAARGDAQAAALISAAQGALSHFPSSDWNCWSPQGARGASRSNLHLGYSGPGAIVSYMQDRGGNNRAVGHRRWILSSTNRELATGDTPRSNALTVIGLAKGPSNGQWIPWPTAGYFPWQLEPNGRWSLGKPGADFTQASVSVTYNGQEVPVSPTVDTRNFGDPTISWDMDLPIGDKYALHPDDARVDVRVSNVRVGGTTTDYEYSVDLVDARPTTAPSSPDVEEVTRIKGNAMHVVLRPSDRDGGDSAITYTVTASPQGKAKEIKNKRPVTCNTDGQTCVLRGIDPRLDYSVVVVASNSAGSSEPSVEFMSERVSTKRK